MVVLDVLLPGDAVVLGDAHAAAQEVAGDGAGVHAELARGDDAEAAVRGEVGAVGELLGAVGAVGDIVSLFGEHGELRGERAVAEAEGWRLAAPGLEMVLGVLDEDVEGVGDLLHDAKEVDVLAAEESPLSSDGSCIAAHRAAYKHWLSTKGPLTQPGSCVTKQ